MLAMVHLQPHRSQAKAAEQNLQSTTKRSYAVNARFWPKTQQINRAVNTQLVYFLPLLRGSNAASGSGSY
jgi:hypothetical protein